MDDDSTSKSSNSSRSGDEAPEDDEDLPETSRLEAVTSKRKIDELVEKSRRGEADELVDETEQLSREEILRIAARDRDQQSDREKADEPRSDNQRQRKSSKALTRPERPIPPRDERKMGKDPKTVEMPSVRDIDKTTEEIVDSSQLQKMADQERETQEVQRWNISADAPPPPSKRVEFRGRVQNGLRLVIPSRKAAELDLESGDVVVVRIEKSDE